MIGWTGCTVLCRVRLAVHKIVTYQLFDTVIMVIIALSSFALAAEDPVDEKSFR